MRRVLALAAALVTGACAQQPSAPAPSGGTCSAAPAQFVVGQAWTEAVGEQVRQRSGAKVVRVLRPGQVVTMEFSAERVNVQVDAQNRVLGVRCG